MPETTPNNATELPPLGDIFPKGNDDAVSTTSTDDAASEQQSASQESQSPPRQQTQQSTVQQTDGGDPNTASADSQQQSSGEPTLLDQIRGIGFADVDDEKVGVQRLLEAYRQRDEELQAAIDEARAAQSQSAMLIQHLSQQRNSQQEPPQQPASTQAEAESWFKAPAVDPHIEKIYRDAEGNWKPNTPHEIQVEAAKREAAMSKFAEQLISDPRAALEPGIRSVVVDAIKEMMGVDPKELPSRLDLDGSRTAEQRANQLIDSIVPFVYERDPVTQQPNLNRPNQLGIEFGQTAAAIAGSFGVDPQEALNDYRVIQATYAALQSRFAQQVNGNTQQPPAAPAAPPADPNANGNGNGTGTVTPAAQRETERSNFRRRRASATSASGGYTASGDPEARPIASDIAAGQAFARAFVGDSQ